MHPVTLQCIVKKASLIWKVVKILLTNVEAKWLSIALHAYKRSFGYFLLLCSEISNLIDAYYAMWRQKLSYLPNEKTEYRYVEKEKSFRDRRH